MKTYNNWDDIDRDTQGLVTSLTYMVLFLNDQVYNYSVSLMEAIRKSNHYRHAAKKMANGIEREIKAYNTNVFRIAKANKDTLAEITLSMEEDIQPHIERYYYAISQVLLDNSVSGDTNRIASLASTINMLCQMSRGAVNDFFERMGQVAPLAYNPLKYLSLEKVEYLSEQLFDEITGRKIEGRLSEKPSLTKAFTAITNALLKPEVFTRAFEKAG